MRLSLPLPPKPAPPTGRGRAVLAACALLALACGPACAPLPDFAAYGDVATGPAPRLLPMDQILAQVQDPGPARARAASLAARAARLKARAALMRGPVHDPATRARLAAAIAAGRA